MGDPICKWRAAKPHNVVELVSWLPKESMAEDDFRSLIESEHPGFMHTPYQLACQLGLYAIINGVYYPRFCKNITDDEAQKYLEYAITKYYVPNPYTPRGFKNLNIPIILERSIVEYLEKYPQHKNLESILQHLIKEDVGNYTAIKAFLSYSKLFTIKGDNVTLNPNYKEIMDAPFNRNDKDAFFNVFNASSVKKINDDAPLQTIFYGAPGTGKSHSVKLETEEWEKKGRVVRTTFHPDSDYSTFVGAYKPTTDYVERYDIYNKPIMKDGKPVMEQVITYEFVEQAFLQAYIDAWKNRNEPEYLVIEEINRGNCAQIFGDLFQLLDRGDDGYSDYAIRADKDLQKHLSKAFEDTDIADYPNVKSGKELFLPNNLYIRATMNTSDQSLFPIDSAFKRRWEWRYVPIAKGIDNGVELNWMIEIGDDKYDWWTFVKTINKHVFDMTNSEDKQLGFFFCKAKNNIISADTFVCKVVFYLWNDVFKDFGFDNKIFADTADEKNPKLSFDKFYMANGKVNMAKVKMFLVNLDMSPLFDSNDETNVFMDEDGNTKETVNKDFSKYSINGVGTLSKGKVVQQAVEIFANEHPDMDAEQIVDQWMGLKVNIPNFIESEATYEARVSRSKDSRVREKSKSVTLPNGDIIYVSNQYNPIRIEEFISRVNAADWGIKIEKV